MRPRMGQREEGRGAEFSAEGDQIEIKRTRFVGDQLGPAAELALEGQQVGE